MVINRSGSTHSTYERSTGKSACNSTGNRTDAAGRDADDGTNHEAAESSQSRTDADIPLCCGSFLGFP